MKTKFTFIIVLLFAGLLSISMLSSCSKKKTLSKLNGTWSAIDVAHVVNPEAGFHETWQFNEDNTLKYTTLHQGTTYTINANYTINKHNKLTIENFPKGWERMNGTWNIIKMKNGNLMMVHEIGGLFFREFAKQ